MVVFVLYVRETVYKYRQCMLSEQIMWVLMQYIKKTNFWDGFLILLSLASFKMMDFKNIQAK